MSARAVVYCIVFGCIIVVMISKINFTNWQQRTPSVAQAQQSVAANVKSSVLQDAQVLKSKIPSYYIAALYMPVQLSPFQKTIASTINDDVDSFNDKLVMLDKVIVIPNVNESKNNITRSEQLKIYG